MKVFHTKHYEEMTGVKEFEENMPVALYDDGEQRPQIAAANEGGYRATYVDAIGALAWIMQNRPDLIEQAKKEIGRVAPICPECRKYGFILDAVKCEVRCINCDYIIPWINVEVIPPSSDGGITQVRVILNHA